MSDPCTNWLYHSGKLQVRQIEELESLDPLDHLRTLKQWERQYCDLHGVLRANTHLAGTLSRSEPLRFFSMGLRWGTISFKIPCLCEPSRNPTRFENQHPRRNCQHNTCYANTSHDKRQKSAYAMYGEWGTSPIRFYLLNNVNKNFRHVPTL